MFLVITKIAAFYELDLFDLLHAAILKMYKRITQPDHVGAAQAGSFNPLIASVNDFAQALGEIKGQAEPGDIEQLKQLITITWDGNLVSKAMRDRLLADGLCTKVDGWNIITPRGVKFLKMNKALPDTNPQKYFPIATDHINELREIIKRHRFNFEHIDPGAYTLGHANGLIHAIAVLFGNEPVYIHKPCRDAKEHQDSFYKLLAQLNKAPSPGVEVGDEYSVPLKELLDHDFIGFNTNQNGTGPKYYYIKAHGVKELAKWNYTQEVNGEVYRDRLAELAKLIAVQCSDGNANYSPYMYGMANGMILAKSVMDAGECVYMEKPKAFKETILPKEGREAIPQGVHLFTEDTVKEIATSFYTFMQQNKCEQSIGAFYRWFKVFNYENYVFYRPDDDKPLLVPVKSTKVNRDTQPGTNEVKTHKVDQPTSEKMPECVPFYKLDAVEKMVLDFANGIGYKGSKYTANDFANWFTPMQGEYENYIFISPQDDGPELVNANCSEILRVNFMDALVDLINTHNLENASNTPDFMLAEFLCNCLDNFNVIVAGRDQWKAVGAKDAQSSPTTDPGPTQAGINQEASAKQVYADILPGAKPEALDYGLVEGDGKGGFKLIGKGKKLKAKHVALLEMIEKAGHLGTLLTKEEAETAELLRELGLIFVVGGEKTTNYIINTAGVCVMGDIDRARAKDGKDMPQGWVNEAKQMFTPGTQPGPGENVFHEITNKFTHSLEEMIKKTSGMPEELRSPAGVILNYAIEKLESGIYKGYTPLEILILLAQGIDARNKNAAAAQ